jgi:hypothetical protein
MDDTAASTQQKALALNLAASAYGTFAEIGGGQEVARWFFVAGGAAGTVAKTISAYDMSVSDQLYGHTTRYVSRQRLEAMLKHEFDLLAQQLSAARGDAKRFFVFADTVATRAYGHSGNGRGWLGVRFQSHPRCEPSEIIIHAQLLDTSSAFQQNALGILGVNLIYGALLHPDDPHRLIDTLLDDLSRERVEIDMIKLSGPSFAQVDNRLMSLQLVERNMTHAAMFTAQGETVQPSEVLYKRPVLVERGNFRPPTKLTVNLLQSALKQFEQEPEVQGQERVVLAEMTLRDLTSEQTVSHADFLARADLLRSLGIDVLISRFEAYHQLVEYLARYTDRWIGLAVGLPALRQILDERYYADLQGGVLESAGRLFQRNVRMYVYPARDAKSDAFLSVRGAPFPAPWQHLIELLLEMRRVVPIDQYDQSLPSINTGQVRNLIANQDSAWQELVPAEVRETIQSEKLFGWRGDS